MQALSKGALNLLKVPSFLVPTLGCKKVKSPIQFIMGGLWPHCATQGKTSAIGGYHERCWGVAFRRSFPIMDTQTALAPTTSTDWL